MPASDNLAAYTASAILPRMLRYWADPQSRRPIIDTLDPVKIHRVLTQVGKLSSQDIAELAQNYPLPNLPLEIPDANEDTFDFINVPGINTNGNLVSTQTEMAMNQMDVTEWVETVVLATVQRVLHIFDTLKTERWHISRRYMPAEERPYAEAISSILHRRRGRLLEPKPQVHILTFAPWDLTYWDIKDFAQSTCFNRNITSSGIWPTMTRNDKLWFHVFDRCIAAETRWFVLTNADVWCFGVFANGWKTAFVLEPLAHDSREPTVIQVMFLWAKSAQEEFQDIHGVPIAQLEMFMDDSCPLVEEFECEETPTEPDEEQEEWVNPNPGAFQLSRSRFPLEIMRGQLGLRIQDSNDERSLRLGMDINGERFGAKKDIDRGELRRMFEQHESQRQRDSVTQPTVPLGQEPSSSGAPPTLSRQPHPPKRVHLFRQNGPLTRHYSEPGIPTSRSSPSPWNLGRTQPISPMAAIVVPVPQHGINPDGTQNINVTVSVDGQTLANHVYTALPTGTAPTAGGEHPK